MDESQVAFIGKFIKSHKNGISSMEAFEFGITRLSAVIYELRARGYEIESVSQKCKNSFGHNTNYVRYIYKGESKVINA